jgi:hypothetical protein
VVRGVDGDHNDTLTVDFSGGLLLPGGIDFDGGIGGFDTLRIAGDHIANSLHTPANRSDGVVELGGTEIRYRNLEPIVDTGTASALIFTLPPAPWTSLFRTVAAAWRSCPARLSSPPVG